MSDLDKKLRELDIEFLHDVPVHLTKDAIEKIKQAFIDAGWKQHKNPCVELTDDQTAIFIKHVVSKMMYQQPVMTGQEWYDRFEQNYLNVTPDKPMADAEVTAFWAAKKAAGIE